MLKQEYVLDEKYKFKWMQTAHSLQKSWQEVLKNDNIGIQISCLSKLETKEIYIMYVSFSH